MGTLEILARLHLDQPAPGHQGRFLDRPGTLVDVEVIAAGKMATSVRVTGDAVIVFEAELPI